MCDFNQALNDALEAFLQALDKYTLADLTSREGDIRNLLNIGDKGTNTISSDKETTSNASVS